MPSHARGVCAIRFAVCLYRNWGRNNAWPAQGWLAATLLALFSPVAAVSAAQVAAEPDERVRVRSDSYTATTTSFGDPDEGSTLVSVGGVNSAAAGSGPGCVHVGDTRFVFSRASAMRGNVYRITQTVAVNEIMMQITVPTPTPLHVAVYEQQADGTWLRYPPASDDFIIDPPAAGTLAWQTTGPLQPPIVLNAGFDYAVGFAWGPVATSYGRDDALYPQDTPAEFTFGQVLGLFGLNNITFTPPPDEQLPDQFADGEILVFNLAAQSMQLCIEGVLACCLPDGGCLHFMPADCEAQGGVPLGPGSSCADPGLCCGADNTPCVDDGNVCTDDVCVDYSCTHIPLSPETPCTDDGDECTDDVCDSNADCSHFDSGMCGACCLDTGECTDHILAVTCTNQNGTAIGPGTACSDPGLCCGIDGSACEDDGIPCTQDICVGNNCTHDPSGAGTVCPDDGDECTADVCDGNANCTHPDSGLCGACCVGELCSSPVGELDCVAEGGAWHEGESCASFECPNIVPSHDECDQCMSLDTGVPFIGSTVGSTGTDVSTCTVNDTNDVWHCWTADCSGLVTFETCGGPDPNFDTSLSIFDACGGQQIACNDDGCGVQSRVFNVSVTEGTTYYLRVAGRGGDMGQYRVLVNPCRSACCTSDGHCFMATHDECLAGQGFPQLPGTLCMGDLNQDLIDDACELCAGAPDNTPCEDDGNDCTDDLCISNHCSHEPMIAGTPCLDDGDACTNDVCGDAANCTHVDNGACGACCLTTGACIGAIPIATCEGQGGTFLGAGQSCIGDADDDGIDDACEMFEPIPTVSEWGVVVLALGLAVIAKLCFRRGAAEA